MTFAQLTYRESLRDIEACLRALGDGLYHLGIRGRVSRSTLADANEERDWRIYAAFAQKVIAVARRLYADDPLDLELDQTVYALDSSTIELCLSLFPWAQVGRDRSSVKLHTLLDPQGSIPANLWIAVTTDLLVAIVRKRLGIELDLYTILQVLSVYAFEKTPLPQVLSAVRYTPPNSDIHNQLSLFDL